MTYDDWKLETPEDEAYRKMGRVRCEDCDDRRATNLCVSKYGPCEYFLCEPCAEKRDCPDCGGFGTEFVEDLTDYSGDRYLCVACFDKLVEVQDAAECEP
jgi:hypothetical protein